MGNNDLWVRIFIAIICGALFVKWTYFWENNNIINNIENCHEVKIIEEQRYNKILKTYSCWYHTNSDWQIWWWTCVYAKFKDWVCSKLIMYNKAELYQIDWWNFLKTWESILVKETNPYALLWDKYYNLKKIQEWCNSSGEYIDENWKCTRDLDRFYESIWINTTSWENKYYLWLGYFEKKEYEKAIESFNKAIEINPTFTDAYYNRGITYLMLDNDTWALESFNKAIELDSNYLIAYYYRQIVKYYLNNFTGSIEDCNKIIETNSWYVSEAYKNRGHAYIQLSKYREACEDFKEAKRLWNKNVEDDIKTICNNSLLY